MLKKGDGTECIIDEIVVDTPGFFPNDRRPRVGWLKVVPGRALVLAAERVNQAIEELELKTDRKSFQPHLTLVRTRNRWSRADAAVFLEALSGFRSSAGLFGDVVLFSSEIRRGGAVHTALHRVELAAG